jgi:hypothetical protein
VADGDALGLWSGASDGDADGDADGERVAAAVRDGDADPVAEALADGVRDCAAVADPVMSLKSSSSSPPQQAANAPAVRTAIPAMKKARVRMLPSAAGSAAVLRS